MDAQIKQYFEEYPKSIEVFQTQDGFLFHKNHEAVSHARSLEEKEVVHHLKPYSISDVGDVTDDLLDALSAAMSPAIPSVDAGVNAVAPVVVEPDGEVISPGVGQFSTAPVAAVQTVLPDNVVVDPGTVELPVQPAEEVAPVIDPLAVDMQDMAAKEVELPALDAEEASKAVKAEKAKNAKTAKAAKADSQK